MAIVNPGQREGEGGKGEWERGKEREKREGGKEKEGGRERSRERERKTCSLIRCTL